MFCVKHEYDRNVIINKSLGFYDLKSNKRYIFLMNFSMKL